VVSVLDQIDWSRETDGGVLLQLVSAQLDSQETVRIQVRKQLDKDYPASALGWLPTVTWSAPTLVPLTSFDLSGIKEWPTWKDTKKVASFVERIKNGWHKPIVTVKVPGGRYLVAIDGHTRLCAYYTLKRPVLAWVGKTHATHGPWEAFHSKQRGSQIDPKDVTFATVKQQLVALSETSASVSDAQYRSLLVVRRSARAEHPPGHPDRVNAERDVRIARRMRPRPTVTLTNISPEVYGATHTELLAIRREAQANYPAGHPQRVSAERDVRRSRALSRARKG
jgi:hypothetical protein